MAGGCTAHAISVAVVLLLALQHLKATWASTPGKAVLRPLVYMKDVFDHQRFTKNRSDYSNYEIDLYELEGLFPHLLRLSPYITDSAEAASFILPNVHQNFALATTEEHTLRLAVQTMVKANDQMWAQRHGDFLWIVTNDWGKCECIECGTLLAGSTVMQHYGRVFGDYPSGLHHEECRLLDSWPTECDLLFKLNERMRSNSMLPACYDPAHDLVVPSTVAESRHMRTRFLDPELAKINRTYLMFFAGAGMDGTHMHDPKKPWQDAGYSNGVRQTFFRMFRHRRDMLVRAKAQDNYTQELHSAYFCLATTGWGWSGRFVTSVLSGCIPVIVQDGIKVEWEDQLPLKDFALRVPFMYLHRLPELLTSLMRRPGHVDKMLRNLGCVWPLFLWSRPHGRGLEMTMCALLNKLVNRARGRDGGPAVKISVDWERCVINCGDGTWRPIREEHFV